MTAYGPAEQVATPRLGYLPVRVAPLSPTFVGDSLRLPGEQDSSPSGDSAPPQSSAAASGSNGNNGAGAGAGAFAGSEPAATDADVVHAPATTGARAVLEAERLRLLARLASAAGWAASSSDAAETSTTTVSLELDYVAREDVAEVDVLREMLNDAIASGISYPHEQEMGDAAFRAYFLSHDAFVLRLRRRTSSSPAAAAAAAAGGGGDSTPPSAAADADQVAGDETRMIVAAAYVKPNFPGRCAHICNGGFLVREPFRRMGVAALLARHWCFLARDLGYKQSMFNLVFVVNTPSIALWRRLGFQEHGRIPGAGRLKGHEGKLIDAIQFHRDFASLPAQTPFGAT